MTDAEVILWSHLRRGTLPLPRFRRQHPIGPYVADFACIAARLVLEVDGATHWSAAEIAHDRRREDYLRGRNWRVLRVMNTDVYENLDGVLSAIAAEIPPPPPSAAPPP